MSLDNKFCAYAAGIVDGEGTATLSRHHKNETHSPEVSVSNCNLQLLEFLKKQIGRGVIIKKGRRKQHHKDAYAWTIRGNAALVFLQMIFPYLLVKKTQAALIIENYKRLTRRNGRYTPDVLEQKKELVSKIRLLNKR